MIFTLDVIIQQPAKSGSHFYDYKGHNSILAMVEVGPEYEIVAADVGKSGRMSDVGNWSRNKFRDKNNPLNITKERPLPGRTHPVPFVAVGDNAFTLTTYLLLEKYKKECLKAVNEDWTGDLKPRRSSPNWRPLNYF